MAKSQYEYVKLFEENDRMLPNTFLMVRVDGRSFHKFTQLHSYAKPNDKKALELMNKCVMVVMKEIDDLVFAYGQSDEYSFLFKRTTEYYKRRACKLISAVTSLFTSAFVFHWNEYFEIDLLYPPSFDGRVVCYPTEENVIDYFSWRQVDCHINNMYNTCFWELVKSGATEIDAERQLKGTVSSDKNELLFQRFGINYNSIEPMFRKGSCVYRKQVEGEKKRKLVVENIDIIKKSFWSENKILD